uniref:RING-type domain-containing protein n=1 Tax=Biomphalaria glabrata TaxID=6526 RepID=A0A182YU10_BIOGL
MYKLYTFYIYSGRESRLNIRKAYHYAIDTCDGCSGAPVIGFKKVTPNSESNGDGFLLDVWVHNGVNIVHSLGCSVLRELTEEEIFLLNDRSQTVTGQSDSDSDTERSTETPNYSSVLKVQTSPFYPDFTCYQKRLESCATWQFSHIHRPQTIALAGFFYSGYSDCVKCFYCGLGLKSWKPGDDLHTEHLKNKPTCIYLKRLSSVYTLKEGAEVTSDAVKNVENLLQTSYSSEALTLNSDSTGSSVEDVLGLLRLENRKLREQVLCKVCHLAPVKDLFLPCGELIACTECSKLLTHCASCGKQILATITTYFV